MRSLRSNADQAFLLGNLWCDAHYVSRYIASDESAFVRNPCRGDRINLIDCRDIDRDVFIEDAGGLDMRSKILLGDSPLIEQNITVIPREWFDRPPDTVTEDVVGIRLEDILSDKPRNKWGTLHMSDDVHVDLSALSSQVFQGKKVVLFATGPDVLIECLWWRRHLIGLYEAIATGNFYAVTGINFSLFLGECPLGQLININKSLQFTEEIAKIGIPIIPHVYAVNNPQRSKWVDILNSYPNIRTVVINAQMQRDKHAKKELGITINALVNETNVNIVINGYKPKNFSDWTGRVFMANQHGLKQRAIIESALLKLASA